jgi:hypothetical protein
MIVLNPIIESRKQAQRERYRKWRNTAAGRASAIESKKKWDQTNESHRKEYRRQYREKTKLDRRLYEKEWNSREEVKLKRRDRMLWANYRLSLADFESMVASQNGLCAVCQQNPAEHVDHCHSTGAVRGVLCSSCNKGLGYFRDNTALLSKAINYLTPPPPPPVPTLPAPPTGEKGPAPGTGGGGPPSPPDEVPPELQ